ncbi:MAG: alpha-L-fucosidase [Candidatus Sulfopaludibacter sp.]|nr:alpha-L-fucosidase [Candidatus Sulfopaludibacter sp.]
MTREVALLFLAWMASGFAQGQLPRPDRMGVTNTGPYDYGVMGPPATPAIVAAADKAVTKAMPAGPFAPAWESLEKNYRTPSWFEDAKFGIFMHWGIFPVPAHHNEWYEKHMYGADSAWHVEHFGPQERFGYKDFIPLFTAAKWDPDAWATLFRKAGARLVMGMAQHHENFALWDSEVTPYNAKRMGPHRDLVGDLAAAVRKQGLKFGLSNHGVENFTFVNPPPELRARLEAAKADLFDPKWAAFYNVADRGDAAMTRFLTDWVNRNLELIDKYQPDILWFDNGANLRLLDPLKLHIAAYYYNRARQWRKEVSLSTKFNAYAPSNDDTKQIGSIVDFEKVGTRSPAGIRPGPWMVDDPIGSNSWGYIEGLRVASAGSVIGKLIDTVSKGGVLLLNISPMADGTIPQNQQDVLLEIGAWLAVNGEAIYGTRPWSQFTETETPAWHFTTKGGALYAIAGGWPAGDAAIHALAGRTVERVALLGGSGPLEFSQDAEGLRIKLPAEHSGSTAWCFKIELR